MATLRYDHTSTVPGASVSLQIPADWAGKNLLIRAWMRADEAAPKWNSATVSEHQADRTVPYSSEQAFVLTSRNWRRMDFCALREFTVPAARVKPGEVNWLTFAAGEVDQRGELTVGTMPVLFGLCGRAVASRKKLPLSPSEWSFALVRTPGEADNLMKNGLPAGSATIPVPSNWEMKGFSKPTYGQWKDEAPTIGVYERRFDAKPVAAGKRTHLVFEGASSASFISLNDQWVGDHESSYTASEFDISDLLASDGKNDLRIRVDKYSRSAHFDGAHQAGYWYLGGIYRNVYAYTMPETAVTGYRYDTSFDSSYKSATVAVTVEITSHAPSAKHLAIKTELTAPNGKRFEATSQLVEVALAHDGWAVKRHVQVMVPVKDAVAWTAETPHLYTLKIALLDTKGKTADEISDRIGLRELKIDGQLFTVNGVPVKLRGVCRHDFSPVDGYATNEKLWKKDLQLMKLAGINAIRMSHYSPSEGVIRLCDEMGFYVIHESAAMWVGNDGDDWYPPYYVRTCDTLRRDMNHPSVLIWGIGNEHPDTTNFRRSALLCRRSDSRPVVYAGMPWVEATDGDIATPHYVLKGIADYVTPERLQLVSDSARPKPVICTEDYTVSRNWWPRGGESLVDDFASYWDDVVYSEPRINGCFLWEWDERAVVWQDKLLLSNTVDYGVNIYESQVGPWRETTLPWFTLLKQVYAPVKILAVMPTKSGMTISVRNQQDFISYPTATLTWTLTHLNTNLKPVGTVCEGKEALSLDTHDTKVVTIKTPAAKPGEWRRLDISVKDTVGKIIAERRIHFPASQTAPVTAPVTPSDTPEGVTLTAAGTNYTFTKDGRIVVEHADNKTILGVLRPNLWITPPAASRGGFPDRASEFDATELVCDAPGIEGNTIVVVSRLSRDGNVFTIKARYQATAEGLLVDYSTSYTGAEMHVPAVGVRFELPVSFDSWQWRGLGPWATYPNLELGADYGVFAAPVVTKRKVGAEIPMSEEPLVGQWEEQGGNKSHTDHCVLQSDTGTLTLSLLPAQSVECERVGDMVEVRINNQVGSLGDRLLDLATTSTFTGRIHLVVGRE